MRTWSKLKLQEWIELSSSLVMGCMLYTYVHARCALVDPNKNTDEIGLVCTVISEALQMSSAAFRVN